MLNPDYLLYAAHAAFWAGFGLAGLYLKSRTAAAPPSSATAPTPAASSSVIAPHSRLVLAVHFVAFGVMYLGLGSAIVPNQVPSLFTGQRVVGFGLLAVGAALMAWARVWFHSWRYRAQVDVGHELATGGPFRYLRHPIYMGLNLLALGSAIWVPTVLTWAGVVLMVLGSDLRGRAEERMLTTVFGEQYLTYLKRTARFIPGVY